MTKFEPFVRVKTDGEGRILCASQACRIRNGRNKIITECHNINTCKTLENISNFYDLETSVEVYNSHSKQLSVLSKV